MAAGPGAPWPSEWTFEIPSSDGRLARGQRTRRNVAEALVDLLREGDPDPTAKAIAERAGVSLRLVFHHFTDIDDLYNAVGALQLERHWTDLPELPAKLSLSSRIERTVRHRSILYEEVSPVRRAAIRRSGSSPRISEAMAYTDGLLVQNLSSAFAPELAQTEEGAARRPFGVARCGVVVGGLGPGQSLLQTARAGGAADHDPPAGLAAQPRGQLPRPLSTTWRVRHGLRRLVSDTDVWIG